MSDAVSDADAFAARSLAAGDPTGWFEDLYADGTAVVPWDRSYPNEVMTRWPHGTDGSGRTAVVVGCGLGRDAEFVAGLGFATTAFDVSPTAVRTARDRHPESTVDYRVADLLDPPPGWSVGFDLVVESYTVQALPLSVRAAATAGVGALVAPGGTLLVIAAVRADDDTDPPGPPWPLTRSEVDAFGAGLSVTSVDVVPTATGDRWRAVFTRR
jgi:SAM-dependent methyltransferase